MQTRFWKSLAASLLAMIAALCGYLVGYQQGGGSLGDESSITSVTYPVRDLIVSWDPARTEPDYASLIDCIETNASQDSWNATRSIEADKKLMSLVISQTKQGHQEIATLLSQLRSFHDQYTDRTQAGKCGVGGKATLPKIAERCTGCGYIRHDPPQA